MNLKEKLQELKIKIKSIKNKDYEFIADLDNHQIKETNIYRLHYMDFYRIGITNGMNITDVLNISYTPFQFPENINQEDGFKILSYLTDYIKTNNEIEQNSYKLVTTLDKIINLENLLFTIVDNNDINEDEITDLFVINGRILLFKNHPLYLKYFDWYKEGITLDDVKEIYNNLKLDFNSSNDKIKKILKK